MSPAPHPRMHGLSHVPGGPDPIPNLPTPAPTGDDITSIILGFNPTGFWKLNEDSGSTAFDSSGFGNDMAAAGFDPTWQEPAGPPGDQTAAMRAQNELSVAWTSMLDESFTAGLFYKRDADLAVDLIGQGSPGTTGQAGWKLQNLSSAYGGSQKNRPYFIMSNGVGAAIISGLFGDNEVVVDEWVFVAAVYDHTIPKAKIYVNGILHDEFTLVNAYAPSVAKPLWIGFEEQFTPGSPPGSDYFTGSYAFFVPAALTSTQLLQVWESTDAPIVSADGQVLTTDGDGGTYWSLVQPASIQPGEDDQVLTTVAGEPAWVDAPTPLTDAQVWMPLTTIVAGVPELVWDGDDQLIPTITDI